MFNRIKKMAIIPALAVPFSTVSSFAAATASGIGYTDVTDQVQVELTSAGPTIAAVLGLSLAVLFVVKLVKRAH